MAVKLPVLVTRITIELTSEQQNYLVRAKQGDKATRFISVLMVNDGEEYAPPAGADLIANFKKPDGTFCYNAAARETGTNRVLVELTNQVLAVPGEAVCEVEIRAPDSTQVLSSCTFTVVIDPDVRDESAILSSNEMTAFDAKWAKINLDMDTWANVEAARVEAEKARVAAETQRQNDTAAAIKKTEEATKKTEEVTERAETALENQEQLNQTLAQAQGYATNAGNSAAAAAKSATQAEENAKKAAEDAEKVINEGVGEKLEQVRRAAQTAVDAKDKAVENADLSSKNLQEAQAAQTGAEASAAAAEDAAQRAAGAAGNATCALGYDEHGILSFYINNTDKDTESEA